MTRRALLRPMVVAAAIFGIAGIARPSTTHASSLINAEIPLAGTIVGVVNPCNGDPVTFVSGYEHIQGHQDSGNFNNFGFDLNFHQATAVDDVTGILYHVTQNTHFVTAGGTGAFISQTETDFHFLSQGSTPNFDAHGVIHMTIDDKGNVTASFTDLTFACRG